MSEDATARDPGYTAATAFPAEGVRAGLVSCLTCGAAVLLDHRDTTDVLRLHADWHAQVRRA